MGEKRPPFSPLAYFWSLLLAVTLAFSASEQAEAKVCSVLIGWTSEGQFIRDEACETHYIAKERGFSELKLSGSQKYQFRFRASKDSTKDVIVKRVGYVCGLVGSDSAVFTANRGTRNALIVSFSCNGIVG
ncbi:hypothetical protein [Ruegeria faecimaris]|uniref:hypothetical protein n=1 Tax=Ruegeria faecimaris TaxID=686389 RepID=UPI002493A400|nr:hypothetical protein [Ruegeria faecimaris]